MNEDHIALEGYSIKTRALFALKVKLLWFCFSYNCPVETGEIQMTTLCTDFFYWMEIKKSACSDLSVTNLEMVPRFVD